MWALFSFETPFALFIFAGIYKADPRLSWVPVDLTAFFAGLSGAVGIWILARRASGVSKRAVAVCCIYGLFVGLAATSLLWSPSTGYGPHKVLALATLVAWSLGGAALVIGPQVERVERFGRVVLWLGLVVALEVIWTLSHPGALMGGTGGVVEHYLASGRLFGTSAIVAAAVVLSPSARRFQSFGAIAALGLFIALMLLLGGRGPFLALIVSLAIILSAGARLSARHLLAVRPRTALLVGVLGLAFIVVTVLLLSGDARLTTVQRFALLLTEGGGASAGTRLYYYHTALGAWAQAPLLGQGIGGWPVFAYHIDERNYPHNILLEALAELGAAGAALMGALVATALGGLKSARRWPADTAGTLAWGFLLSAFLNALVTGDFGDNRFFFVSLGLVAGLGGADGKSPKQIDIGTNTGSLAEEAM